MTRFYLFRIHWLWKHRTWKDSRQKFKAMERDWAAHEALRKKRGKMTKVERYVQERDEMLLKRDVKELRKFVAKHRKHFSPEFRRHYKKADDRILQIALHKMIVNATSLPWDFRQKSADWLLGRGFRLDIY